MQIVKSPLIETTEVQENIFIQKVHSPEIAAEAKPGNFLNIRVSETIYPLLRRPFSICDVDGEYIFLMYNVTGEGTGLLAHKKPGSLIDILGPLGNGYNFESDYDTAVIVAGGLGAAPFPFLTRKLANNKNILSLVGGRNKRDVITYNLENVLTASDDGSEGMKGNVVDLFKANMKELNKKKIKVFACGPTPMLRALKNVCIDNNINCEVSTECAMACGFGICQGCPIESSHNQDTYLLVCKDGPVFNVKDVLL
ncbi:MAG: dihydroorotate dehydrogenase electron transfer subunit [Ignavibacterium sp.]|nr:dihydroorotate dehydrogenase electron transfer subunit [Ignavibacterium sp.]